MKQTMDEIRGAINLTKGEINYLKTNLSMHKGGTLAFMEANSRVLDAIGALRKLEKIKTIMDVEMRLEGE